MGGVIEGLCYNGFMKEGLDMVGRYMTIKNPA